MKDKEIKELKGKDKFGNSVLKELKKLEKVELRIKREKKQTAKEIFKEIKDFKFTKKDVKWLKEQNCTNLNYISICFELILNKLEELKKGFLK